MVVYAFANLGIWGMILMLRKHEYAGEKIDDFEGLHYRAPFFAFAMFVFLLSLGGIPPTAGFIGKYYLFAAAVAGRLRVARHHRRAHVGRVDVLLLPGRDRDVPQGWRRSPDREEQLS